jgi:hypothetical protein
MTVSTSWVRTFSKRYWNCGPDVRVGMSAARYRSTGSDGYEWASCRVRISPGADGGEIKITFYRRAREK